MSGIYSPITNAHRYFESQIDTTPIGAGVSTAQVWVTIPFVNFGKISRFTLETQNGIGTSPYYDKITMCVLNDGAAVRIAGDAPVGVTETLDASGRVGQFDFADTYYEDQYRTRKLYARICGVSTFQEGLYFNVRAEGTQQQPFANSDWETNFAVSYHNDRIYRQTADGSIVNLTSELRQNGNPYTFGGSPDTTKPYTVLKNASEYLYVGSDEVFDTIYFEIPEIYRVGSGNTNVLREYWNGSAWTRLTHFSDNTSNGIYPNTSVGIDSTGFNFSGVFHIDTVPTNWSAYDLPTDPDVVLRNGITTGYHPAVFIGTVRPKYWLRFSMPVLSSDIRMTRVAIWRDYR